MKNTMKTLVMAIIIAGVTFSFTNIDEIKKEIKIDKSKIVWKGYKVTGSHEGTISLKSGSLTFKENKLVGGAFVIDMTTLINTDQEGEYKGKLEGHLKSDDFFGVATHPTASLVFIKVKAMGKNSYKINATLTIKGKTNPIEFDISIYGNKASATLKVDRSKYDVRYGSTSFFDNLADKAIYDEFELVTDLEF